MPLITPVFGLPPSAIERLSDSDGKGRQRERQKEKGSESKNPMLDASASVSQEAVHTNSSSQPEERQSLDSETVVKLLEEQVEPQKDNENRSHSVSDAYNHVKNLTNSIKTIREI